MPNFLECIKCRQLLILIIDVPCNNFGISSSSIRIHQSFTIWKSPEPIWSSILYQVFHHVLIHNFLKKFSRYAMRTTHNNPLVVCQHCTYLAKSNYLQPLPLPPFFFLAMVFTRLNSKVLYFPTNNKVHYKGIYLLIYNCSHVYSHNNGRTHEEIILLNH